jgi:hypothetical protein
MTSWIKKRSYEIFFGLWIELLQCPKAGAGLVDYSENLMVLYL